MFTVSEKYVINLGIKPETHPACKSDVLPTELIGPDTVHILFKLYRD